MTAPNHDQAVGCRYYMEKGNRFKIPAAQTASGDKGVLSAQKLGFKQFRSRGNSLTSPEDRIPHVDNWRCRQSQQAL
jgi:hypothetical protein